ncbi:MAG: DUF3667 domain-containing protein [Bacteroidaceae bacterium]|nr:DUF3667 domain-containing protein [Bacteroidaceae bacterium]
MRLKNALRRLDAMQQRADYNVTRSEERHTCPHCQNKYAGHYCPQCGLGCDSSRFTAKTIMRKMLDVIGFEEDGQHSLLRTLRDLLWRPGYMIRDYLGGHSPAYFQPFKLLLLLVLIFTLLIHMLGIEGSTESFTESMKKVAELQESEAEVERMAAPLIALAAKVIRWFSENMAYSIILQNIFIVTAIWKVYRRRAPYTWSETFVAQMYICCQFMLLTIAEVLLLRRYSADGLYPYLVNDWVVTFVLLYDFFQLYGERRFWPALWRLIKVDLWLILQYALLILIAIALLVVYLAIRTM